MKKHISLLIASIMSKVKFYSKLQNSSELQLCKSSMPRSSITIGLTVHSSYFENRTVIYLKFIALLSKLDSKAKHSFFLCGQWSISALPDFIL